MKKLSVFLIALLATVGSLRAQTTTSIRNGMTLLGVSQQVLSKSVTHGLLSPDEATAAARARKAASAKRAPALSALKGYYYTTDYGISTPISVERRYMVEVSVTESDSVAIYNLMGGGRTVYGVYDAAAGIIKVKSQIIHSDATYGDFYCCYVDWAKRLYYPNVEIEFQVDDSGNISTGNWGAFVLSGQYKNSQIISSKSVFYRANATITDYSLSETDESKATRTYPCVYSRENKTQIAVRNFYNNGSEVTMSVDSTGEISMPRQVLATSGTTNYYSYSITSYTTASDVKLSALNLKGTFSGSTITLGAWALSPSTVTSKIVESLTKTEIKTPEEFAPYSMALTLKGGGTENDPYLIETAEDIENLAVAVNNNTVYKDAKNNVFTGKYFRQTADIDMKTVENHQQIGVDKFMFNARYDGQNHTISNLKHNRRSNSNGGFFGLLGADAVVENLKFTGSSVNGDMSKLGTVVGENNGTVRNITVTGGYVGNAAFYGGGIVGMNYGTIDNVSFSGTVDGESMIGGVVGVTYNKVSNSWSDATVNITAKSGYGGGVSGSLVRDTAEIKDSYFVGTVSSTYVNCLLGGVTGYISKGTVTRCWNGGQVSDECTTTHSGYIGGVVGHMVGGKVQDSYNSGIVRSYKSVNVGGLAGQIEKGKAGTVNETEAPVLKGSLNTGVVICSAAAKENEISGTCEGEYSIQNSYFDNQANYNGSLENGLSTAELISGTAPQGFDASAWTFTKGQYPQLTKYIGTEKAKLDAVPFTLAAGETVKRMKTDFTLSTINDVKWYLYKDGKLGSEGHGLKMNGSNVQVTAQTVESDTLAAVRGNDFRIYIIKVTPDEFEGKGTAAEPYLIKSFADIKKIKTAVDTNLYDYEGMYLKLANDIDMSEAGSFIGLSVHGVDYAFNGTFDGDGHSIKNWKVNRSFTADGYNESMVNAMAGLFIYTGKKAVVKNLNVSSECSIAAGKYVASVVAYNAGTVENCRNYASVKAVNQCAAGVVAYNAEGATVTGCYNAGEITAGGNTAGGINAYNLGTVELSQNDGKVSVDSLTAYVTDKTKMKTAGGVVADNGNTVTNCANYGYVKAAGEVGGIIGSNDSKTTVSSFITGGVVETTNELTTIGAAFGSHSKTSSVVADGYYDGQLTNENAANAASLDGISEMKTAEIVSGDTIQGLSRTAWTYKKGCYPVLTAFVNEAASIFNSQSYVQFEAGDKKDSRFSVRNSAKIVAPDGVTFSLARSNKFSISGNTLNIAAVTQMELDTLTFTNGTYSKQYPLAAAPKMLASGDGSKSNPWQITSVDDWNTVAKFSENYTASFDGEYFILNNDLDFKKDSSACLMLVGDKATKFQGFFDGNGKTIDNFTYVDSDSKTGENLGLFGLIGDKGVVENLTLGENTSITGYKYVGGFAAVSAGTMRNCVNRAAVTTSGMGFCGGLVASASAGARFYNCKNYGTIADANNAAGGIAGYTDDDVDFDSCYNAGSVTGKYSVGGITGSSKANLTNCLNEGDINATSYYVGGIAGYLDGYNHDVSNCVNRGKLYAAAYGVGGIIGNLYGQAIVKNNRNYGEVETKTNGAGGIIGQTGSKGGNVIENCVNYAVIKTGTYNAGGIIGSAKKPSINGNNLITRNVNYGSVEAKTYKAGGIAGESLGSNKLDGNINYGKVTGTNYLGGISGQATDTIVNCVNVADVEGTYSLGGVAGYTASAIVIASCANLGNVTSVGETASKSYNVGGILGSGKISISDSYNTGKLTAFKQVGGIVGLPTKNSVTVRRAYNLGKVECVSADDEASCGNICGGKNVVGITTDSVFYDKLSALNVYDNDTSAVALTTAGLTKLDLGSAWTTRPDCYPVPVALADSAAVKLYSAALVLADGDTRQSVTKNFSVGVPEGISWTVSDNLLLADGAVTLHGTNIGDKATLTATVSGDNSRSLVYELTINTITSGIGAADNAGKEVLRVEYTDMNGRRMSGLTMGVNIVRTVYADGTSSVQKVVVSRKR